MKKNIFEVAVRNRMRFAHKGSLSVEDLWDLSVKELDEIYKKLKAESKKENEDSLLATKTVENETLEIKIEIVKHIVQVKLDEAEASKNAKLLKERKQQLLAIKAEKESEELRGKSAEEIQKMIDELEA